MRSKNARALVVANAPQGTDTGRTNGPPSPPFANFVAALEKNRSPSSENGSIAVWTDFPLERAIASGLWLLMVGLAKSWNVKMSTERSVANVAERTDVLLNAGLALGFSSPEDAAAAWKRTVERPIERAFVLGYRPGTDLPLAAWQELVAGNEDAFVEALSAFPEGSTIGLDGVWQKPVASFFAGVVKTCRRWTSETDEALAQFQKRNTINRENLTGMGFTYIDEDAITRETSKYLRILADTEVAENEETKSAVPYRFFQEPSTKADLAYMYARLPAIRPIIGECLQRVDFFRKLPHRFSAKSRDPSLVGKTVANEWLCTQILLAVGGHPDRDHISVNEHLAALAKLRGVDNETIVKAVTARFNKRGMKLPAKAAARFSAEIVDRLEGDRERLGLRDWSTKSRNKPDEEANSGVIAPSSKERRDRLGILSDKEERVVQRVVSSRRFFSRD